MPDPEGARLAPDSERRGTGSRVCASGKECSASSSVGQRQDKWTLPAPCSRFAAQAAAERRGLGKHRGQM